MPKKNKKNEDNAFDNLITKGNNEQNFDSTEKINNETLLEKDILKRFDDFSTNNDDLLIKSENDNIDTINQEDIIIKNDAQDTLISENVISCPIIFDKENGQVNISNTKENIEREQILKRNSEIMEKVIDILKIEIPNENQNKNNIVEDSFLADDVKNKLKYRFRIF